MHRSLLLLSQRLAVGRPQSITRHCSRSRLSPLHHLPLRTMSTGGPRILDGRELSRQLRKNIKDQVEAFKAEMGYAPHLAIITVGERPAEEAQRRSLFASGPGEASWFDKVKGATEAGMDVTHTILPGDVTFEDLRTEIEKLGRMWNVHGIMVEQPLPEHLTPYKQEIWSSIKYFKDVDGMHPMNAGRLMNYAAGLGRRDDSRYQFEFSNLPTTPLGALQYLDMCNIDIPAGARVVVIGRSKLVGLPLALMLLGKDATVTIAHSHTPREELEAMCKEADVVVGAVGQPRLIQPSWLKKDAVVINIGTTFMPEEKAMVGDVNRQGIEEVTSFLTPSPYVDPDTGKVGPSGVGPLTLPMLLHSTLESARRQVRAHKKRDEGKMMAGAHSQTPVLTSTELREALEGPEGLKVKGWGLVKDEQTQAPALRKTWVVKDFSEACKFIADVSKVADRENHHPTMSVTHHLPGDGRAWCDNNDATDVTLTLTTAISKDLTVHDLSLAKVIDALVFEGPDARPRQSQ